MPMESLVKFHSPKNISGASQQNSIAAFSWRTEVDGDLFWNVKKQPKNTQYAKNGPFSSTINTKKELSTKV